MQKILMLSRNARAISGNVALNSCQLKNVGSHLGPARRVRDREDDDREEDDGAEQRDGDAPAAFAAGAQSIEQARAPVYFKTGAPVAFASHSCWSRLSVPFARSDVIALFDARGERVALREHDAEAIGRAALVLELAEDLAVRHLHGRHVERRRQVDHEPVDLLVLQRDDRGRVRVEDGRLLRRLDAVLDVRVARRAELRAELERLQARDLRTARSSSPC